VSQEYCPAAPYQGSLTTLGQVKTLSGEEAEPQADGLLFPVQLIPTATDLSTDLCEPLHNLLPADPSSGVASNVRDLRQRVSAGDVIDRLAVCLSRLRRETGTV
jgi:hypothetical protein